MTDDHAWQRLNKIGQFIGPSFDSPEKAEEWAHDVIRRYGQREGFAYSMFHTGAQWRVFEYRP